MNNNNQNITGILLTGGMSKRIGQDKGKIKIGNRFLFQYALNALEQVCDEIIIMTVIAILFWNPSEAAAGNLKNGLIVGLEMSLRGIVVVTAFSGLSIEIRNPVITNVVFNRGLSNFYTAVSLAFNSLPVMLDRSAKVKSFFKKPIQSFSNILYEAELWLKYYQTHPGK